MQKAMNENPIRPKRTLRLGELALAWIGTKSQRSERDNSHEQQEKMGNCIAATSDGPTEERELSEDNKQRRKSSQWYRNRSRVDPFGGFWGGNGFYHSGNPQGLGRSFASTWRRTGFGASDGGQGFGPRSGGQQKQARM